MFGATAKKYKLSTLTFSNEQFHRSMTSVDDKRRCYPHYDVNQSDSEEVRVDLVEQHLTKAFPLLSRPRSKIEIERFAS